MHAQLERVSPRETLMSEKAKRVLLLEDDSGFQEILQEFLKSHHFDVVAVQNGVDGVREIMASDFEVIICDMMMPSLPGDMFYLAVERMRPHLCKRFVFITGLRGNDKITEFINRVGGTMLAKPFHVDDLLELISFVEIKSQILRN